MYKRSVPPLLTVPYQSPAGCLLLGSAGNRLCLCDWARRPNRDAIDTRIRNEFGGIYDEDESDIIPLAIEQLDEYFRGRRTAFTVPVVPVGTPFQQQVWAELTKVPCGETISYSDLAGKLGNPDAVRAVAAAVGANALSVFIPCHRIIGADGSLTGYAGGIPAKEYLLKLEKKQSQFSMQTGDNDGGQAPVNINEFDGLQS